MLRKRWLQFIFLLLFAFTVSACAQLIGQRNATPTLPLPTVTVPPTSAPQPTAAPAATATVTPLPSPTIPSPTPTTAQSGTCTYRASFIADVNYPDNSVVPAGTTFIKTWRLRNNGTCSWGKAGFALHSAVFVGGDKLGAPDSVELAANQVDRGQMVDVSIPFVAPTAPGTYKSQWKLRVDNGPLVGVDALNVPFYVQIIVSSATTGTPTRVTFASGATEAQVSGTLTANQTQQFVLQILQGQTLMLNLSSSSNLARVTVVNTQATRTTTDGGYWLGTMPATRDYIISVSAGGQATNFTLDITIPQRITFAPNTTAAAVSGVTDARRVVTYLLRARAGQTLNAKIIAPPNTFVLTIYGLDDGSPLINGNMSGATSWSGQLPATQDYVIQIMPVLDGTLNFTLQVIVQ